MTKKNRKNSEKGESTFKMFKKNRQGDRTGGDVTPKMPKKPPKKEKK